MLFGLRGNAANIDQVYRSKSVQAMKDTINRKRSFFKNHTITLERNVMEKLVTDRIKNWKMFLGSEECITEREFLLYYKVSPRKHKLLGKVYSIKLKPKSQKYKNRIVKHVVFCWEEILKVYPAITQIKGSGLNAKYASDIKVLEWYKDVLRPIFPEHAFDLLIRDNYDERRPEYVLYIFRKILDYDESDESTAFEEYNNSTDSSFENGHYEVL